VSTESGWLQIQQPIPLLPTNRRPPCRCALHATEA
jgi:hypothetical protein